MLTLRHLVEENEGLFRICSGEEPLLNYYANSITHLLVKNDLAQPSGQGARSTSSYRGVDGSLQ